MQRQSADPAVYNAGAMSKAAQPDRARQLLGLHRGAVVLLLPNAWDVSSARIFEDAGFPAIGTTSAGIAVAHGYPDGQKIPRDEMLSVIRRIAEAVEIPVSADMEGGYGATPDEVAATARAAIAAGAVGMNLEDGSAARPDALNDLSLQTEILRAVSEASQSSGVPAVLNARTDVFLRAVGEPEKRVDRAIERLNAYRKAGAHCLFAPGVTDAETIGRLVRSVAGPLNVLATTGTPPVAELKKLGVARVSLGSGAMRATLGLLARLARQLQDTGAFSAMTEGAMSYADANRLVRTREG
jgi:2-methylisocitrate lyase-like PEP mutase family enzyme